ncbi:MAG: cytochrome P450 [Polyangiaceae bacterium]
MNAGVSLRSLRDRFVAWSEVPLLDGDPPSPPTEPLVGHLRQLRAGQISFYAQSCVELGDVVKLRFGNRWRGLTAFLLSHPDHIRHVLQDHHRNFHKRTRGFDKLRLILGNGLLTSEGAFWLRQRRIAQPAFHRDRIAAFGSTMVRATEEMIDKRWAGYLASGRPFDVSDEMMRLTLRIVSETLMSRDLSDSADSVGHALDYLLSTAIKRIQSMIEIPMSVPTPSNRRLQEAIRTIDDVVLGVIEQRRREKDHGTDLIGLLMSARDEETGEGMTDAQLRDEVITIFIAGHETTANALTWTLHLLSTHPHVERELREELANVLGGRSPTPEDLPRLNYTKMVIQESMRLYPPAWTIGRGVEQDDEIGGYKIPAGSMVIVSPYLVHHNPRIWSNPEGFDPTRFSPENAASIPKFAYFPFGAGPRQCIGNGFAMTEAQLVLATMLQRVRLEESPGHSVVAQPQITLRPRDGLWVTAKKA